MEAQTLNPTTDTIGSVSRITYRFQREKRVYKDREFKDGDDVRQNLLNQSSTVYVGNLSFYTSESQLYELFSKCGEIKRVIMGLDRFKKTPCGFCFVEFEERLSAENCVNFLNFTQLDGRQIKIDYDTGFIEGRQYGRGQGGGQKADEKNDNGSMRAGGSGGLPNIAYTTTIMLTVLTLIICYSAYTEAYPAIPETYYYPPMNRRLAQPYRHRLRSIQSSPQGIEFEQYFARLLVDIMKTAKPTLMKAFMKATLNDPKLKEIAINIFFNATTTD